MCFARQCYLVKDLVSYDQANDLINLRQLVGEIALFEFNVYPLTLTGASDLKLFLEVYLEILTMLIIISPKCYWYFLFAGDIRRELICPLCIVCIHIMQNTCLFYCLVRRVHYCDVLIGAKASRITGVPIVYSTVFQVLIKENIKAPSPWPLWGKFTGDRWIPRTKGQERGKRFHFMTSSCLLAHPQNAVQGDVSGRFGAGSVRIGN